MVIIIPNVNIDIGAALYSPSKPSGILIPSPYYYFIFYSMSYDFIKHAILLVPSSSSELTLP